MASGNDKGEEVKKDLDGENSGGDFSFSNQGLVSVAVRWANLGASFFFEDGKRIGKPSAVLTLLSEWPVWPVS